MTKDIQKLEQLLNLNSVSSRKGPSVVDGLYTFAKESQFSLLKVETGESLLIEKYHETSVTIKGKGSYESIGKLIERIENSPQSTRIRQLVLNNASGSEIETQIEFVIIGE